MLAWQEHVGAMSILGNERQKSPKLLSVLDIDKVLNFVGNGELASCQNEAKSHTKCEHTFNKASK